jgi:hypothetical protein
MMEPLSDWPTPAEDALNILWEGRLDHIDEAFADLFLLRTSFHKVRVLPSKHCKYVGTSRIKPYPSATRSLADYQWSSDTPLDAVLISEEFYCRGGSCTSTGTVKYPKCGFRLLIEHSILKSRIRHYGTHGPDWQGNQAKGWGLSAPVSSSKEQY